MGGMQSVTRVCAEPLASSPAAFSRVLVMRNGSVTIGSPLDAVKFFDGISGVGGSSVDSNSVVLSGFSGMVNVTVTGGAHLIVNGVDVGTSANVAAGSTVRSRTTSPTTSGSTASYNLSIGGAFTTAWNVVTRTTTAPALTVPPGVSSTASGYTPVSASVGESGAASIGIPITVPPGTGGMEPKLAIAYSSQGGNGLLGVGFGLSGLSAVTRTGRVAYLDGTKGGVTFDANDRFSIDGQRLVLYSGAWGGDGSEYRTENDSFAKITYHILGSVSYWEVQTKAGLKYNYGNSDDSRILANRFAGDNAISTWAVTAITDVLSNRLVFNYSGRDDSDGGYPRIVSIQYTQNVVAGLVPGEQVIFSYETRPDVRTSYLAGAKVVIGKRLTAVECQQGGNVARRYEMAYQQAEISGNSQLVSVTEKGKKPSNSGDVWQAFPPTVFTWDQKPAANTSLLTTANDPSLGDMMFSRSPFSLMAQGDFNGDGRMDIIHFDDLLVDYYLAFAKADGSFERHYTNGSFVASDAVDPNTSRIRTGDFNGDGRTDVLHVSTGGSSDWVALSNGDGTFRVLRGTQLGALQNLTQSGDFKTELIAMDLDGDGRTDLVLLNASGNNRVFLSNGDGSFREVPVAANDPFRNFRISSTDGTNTFLAPGDYNGDGLGDILLLYAEGQHTLALSNGDGTFTVRNNAQLGGISGVQFHRTQGVFETGDYNGDGITDLAYFDHDTTAWVALSKGDGTFETRITPPMLQGLTYENSGHSRVFAADFNGDGLTDIFQAYYSASSSSWLVSSQGNGNFALQVAGQLGALDGHSYEKDQQSRVFVGDFDGDGTDDVLHLHYQHQGNGTAGNFLALSNGFNADRVVQVTNGHGGYTKITYQPLTNPWGYTKGTTAVYPYVDVIAPTYVVGTLVSRNGIDGDAFTTQTNPTNGESTVFYHYFGATALLNGHGY